MKCHICREVKEQYIVMKDEENGEYVTIYVCVRCFKKVYLGTASVKF